MSYLDGPKMLAASLVAVVHTAAAVAAFHAFAGPRPATSAAERGPAVAVDSTIPMVVITAPRLRGKRANPHQGT